MYSVENKGVSFNGNYIGHFDEIIINDCEARLYYDGLLRDVIRFDGYLEKDDCIYITKDDETEEETVNYYKPHGTEAWDVIDSVLSFYGADLKGAEPFYIGNILKYLLRYKYKGQAQSDLDKLIRYVEKLK